MKLSRRCTVLLGMAIMSPSLVFAQFDPMPPSTSQIQPNRSQTPSPATQDSGPNSGDVGQVMQDKMFLRKVAEGGLAEVKLGQLAAKKGSSDDVRGFAQKMVDDHTQMNNDVARLADAMGVMLPKEMNKEDQAEYDKLSALSGNDFDIEYLTFMVKDHHKDLHAFRIEAASPTDPALHDEVVRAEGVVHEHTVMADKLARTKGVPVPVHGQHPAHAPAPSL